MASTPVENSTPKMFCGECGGSYPVQELSRFGNHFVCVNCKPGYLQRMQTSVQPVASSMPGVLFGGFWIRALAIFIDGIVIGAITTPIFLIIGFGSGAFTNMDPQNPPVALFGLGYLLMLGLLFAYNIWFVTQKGGTLGKLMLGLRVVTTDGRNLTVGRAIGRYFAVVLSGFTFYVGFIIAAFDSEKRALHDHLCATRVIRK